MSWREQAGLALAALLELLGKSGWAVLIAAAIVMSTIALPIFYRRHRNWTIATSAGEIGALDDLSPDPGDRMLPLGREGFLVLIVSVAIGCWLLGFSLARDKPSFFSSKEWRFQPFYVAAHLMTLRLFVAVFTRNFRAGIAQLDVSAERALVAMHRILGPCGALVAFLAAIPFCLSDFRYLSGPKYERLVPGAPLGGVDYAMWSIWCAEWFLNAFIWVILAGFLFNNVRTLSRHGFQAPIEIVLREKQYRPFLRMSSQGATVVLVFALVTVLYIGYIGGAITDYLGLGITALLLVVGFVVPWMQLRRKVQLAVDAEQQRLQLTLTYDVAPPVSAAVSPGAATSDIRALSERLDYVVALLRMTHLEHLHLELGATEARAIAIRLLAPAATIGWQVSQNFQPFADKLGGVLQSVLARLSALGS